MQVGSLGIVNVVKWLGILRLDFSCFCKCCFQSNFKEIFVWIAFKLICLLYHYYQDVISLVNSAPSPPKVWILMMITAS